ncbi:redoxin domain-containing protein [bacterium]|nr:redoxin domain-containing protein [bacterium]
MIRIPIRSIVVVLLLTFLVVGCGSEHYGLSQQVTFLWQQHPAPWSEEAAKAAAEDAKGLMTSHPNDIQLEMYYQDRVQSYDYQGLIDEYKAKLTDDSTNARLILLEARAVGGRNRMATQMKEAVSYAPKDPYVLAIAAMAMLRQRPAEVDLGVDYAREAVVIAPDMSLAHQALAKALFEQEMYEESLQEAEIASEQNPWDFDPVYVAMKSLQAMEKDEEALNRLEFFSGNQPLNPDALYFLERMYRERGELEKVVDRKRLAAEAADDGYEWLDLASVYLEIGWMDSVMSALSSAVDSDFYDLDYTKTMFEADQLKALAKNQEWLTIKDRMIQRRKETRDERRAEALSERLDEPASDWTAVTFDGKEVSMADMKGQVVVLDFWATWCGPCRMTIPRLQEFHQAGAGGAKLISMDVWERVSAEERPDYVKSFAEEEGMVWNVLLAKNQTADDYGVLGIPTFVVIDKQGVIRHKLVGYQPFLDEILGWMVEDAGGKPL